MLDLWVSYLAASLGLFVFLTNYLQVRSGLRVSVHSTSRFPLFAVRDDLRRALIGAKLSLDGPAVNLMDDTVNELLNLDNRDTLVVYFKRCIAAKVRESRDIEFAQRVSATKIELARAAESSPEFARLLAAVDDAIKEMLYHRTSWLSLHGFDLQLRLLSKTLKLYLRCRRWFSLRRMRANDLLSWHSALAGSNGSKDRGAHIAIA